MANKSRPRHRSSKNRTPRKLTAAPSAAPATVESKPNPTQAAPGMETTPMATSRPGLGVAQPVRPNLTVRSRPLRAPTQAMPADFAYVITDLKRIGVISLALFAILAILAVALG